MRVEPTRRLRQAALPARTRARPDCQLLRRPGGLLRCRRRSAPPPRAPSLGRDGRTLLSSPPWRGPADARSSAGSRPRQRPAGPAVPQIMKPDVLQVRPRPHPPPLLAEVGDPRPRMGTRDHPRGVRRTRQAGNDPHSLGRQRHRARPVLAGRRFRMGMGKGRGGVSVRPIFQLPTIFDLQGRTEGDVVQSREPAPHDDVARRRILGAGEIAAEPGDLDEVERDRPAAGGSAVESESADRGFSSPTPVSTWAGSRSGMARLSIVNQNTRQLRMQNTASNRTSRSAVRSRACSARQPDFKILWKTSIFQRMAYQ